MKTIAFLNRKGGTGKTTNAINIANELRAMGFNEVTLIETDNNRSLSLTRQREAPQTKIPALVHSTPQNAVKMVRQLSQALADFAIVDGASNMSAEYHCAIAASSDLVIIPTNTNADEIQVTLLTLRDIAPALRDNPALSVAILPTRIHPLTAQDTVTTALAALQTPVLPYIPNYKMLGSLTTVLRTDQRQIYRDFAQRLITIFDRLPRFTPPPAPALDGARVQSVQHRLTCVCGCEEVFYSTRCDARYKDDTHRKRHSRLIERENELGKGNLVRVLG